MPKPKESVTDRPDLFGYHDHLQFLKDWFAYRKANQRGFSMRKLAQEAGLAVGYLPMVLSGQRPLTHKAWLKLKTSLGFSESEQSFFESLLVLGTSDSHEVRLAALERMRRFHLYQVKSSGDAQTVEYLTHWYYVVIREMAALPDFQLDAEWIQRRLLSPVPLLEIKKALEFLINHSYLEKNKLGRVVSPEKILNCSGGIYRIALGKLHREIFELASQSIERTPNTERNIQGHTFSLNSKNYTQAQKIVETAMDEIRALGADEKNGDSIYHLEIALFPLTRRRKTV